MEPKTLAGRPMRLPHKDPSVGDMRVAWMKMGGREYLNWGGNELFLYWEVWTGQDKYGGSFPISGFVVEHNGKQQRFIALEDADREYEKIERENIIAIAAAALGVT